MRYIRFNYSNGYSGCDETEYVAFPDGTTDEAIEKYADESVINYGEDWLSDSQLIDYPNEDDYPDGYDDPDYMDDYDAAEQYYWENVTCTWDDVSKEEYERG